MIWLGSRSRAGSRQSRTREPTTIWRVDNDRPLAEFHVAGKLRVFSMQLLLELFQQPLLML